MVVSVKHIPLIVVVAASSCMLVMIVRKNRGEWAVLGMVMMLGVGMMRRAECQRKWW